jgi:thiol-disulfide isomerase/thioredoxin
MKINEVKFCPYCKSLMLPNGKCRNIECVLGSKRQVTIKQMDFIEKLCEETEVDISKIKMDELTKEKASKLIDKLAKRKYQREMYGSEVE